MATRSLRRKWGLEGVDLAIRETPDLIVMDIQLPDIDGLEATRRIRAMEAGVDDYLVKPFNHGELRYRIRVGQRIIGLEQRILQLANTDPLTGILNRRAFMERMRGNIEKMVVNLPPDTGIRITGSFGAALSGSEAGEAVDRIIKRADDALYRAKREGRNRVCF